MSQRPPEHHHTANVLGYVLSAMAVLGTVIYGATRKNPYARAGIMGGVGAALKAYSTARSEKAKEMKDLWQKQVKTNHEENMARQQTHKDLMENKKYSLSQKLDLTNRRPSNGNTPG